jgi:hypothetical protein
MARRILALTTLGDLSTVFPSSDGRTEEHRPSGLGGHPIGLMDYISACEGDRGDPTLLAINIATQFRNANAGSNISLSLRWTPPHPPSKRISSFTVSSLFAGVTSLWSPQLLSPNTLPYSAANLPRFSLLGYVELIDPAETDHAELAECFVKAHPDARYWLPGNRIHKSAWARLVVTQLYWIGGFGDRAYIGWIPIEEWRNVTKEEWHGIRLPGEKKGWKEWAVGSPDGWEYL